MEEQRVGHVVNTVGGDGIETIIASGHIVVRDQKVLTLDEREVVKTSRKSARKLWQKLGAIRG